MDLIIITTNKKMRERNSVVREKKNEMNYVNEKRFLTDSFSRKIAYCAWEIVAFEERKWCIYVNI